MYNIFITFFKKKIELKFNFFKKSKLIFRSRKYSDILRNGMFVSDKRFSILNIIYLYRSNYGIEFIKLSSYKVDYSNKLHFNDAYFNRSLLKIQWTQVSGGYIIILNILFVEILIKK
jgi:hypothetical protein